MKRQAALFFARLIANDHKNLFITRLGVYLLLGKYGITGVFADFLSFFIRGLVGLMIETGVFVVDLSLDSYREGKKLEQFKEAAAKAYKKATAKVYDEDQKREIREEYLKIISAIGNVGNPK